VRPRKDSGPGQYAAPSTGAAVAQDERRPVDQGDALELLLDA
jgi:hypothetical protein